MADSNLHYDFLKAEADLAMTFLWTSDIEVESNPNHSANALARAEESLETIRKLMDASKLTAEQFAVIQERCATLDSEIDVRKRRPLC